MATIVLIDDEEQIRIILGLSLKAEGYDVFAAATADEALDYLAEITEHNHLGARDLLVITDIRMPKINGLVVIDKLHEHYPDLPIIICSSMATTPVVENAFEVWTARKQIVASFDKPIHMPNLLSKLNELLDK